MSANGWASQSTRRAGRRWRPSSPTSRRLQRRPSPWADSHRPPPSRDANTLTARPTGVAVAAPGRSRNSSPAAGTASETITGVAAHRLDPRHPVPTGGNAADLAAGLGVDVQQPRRVAGYQQLQAGRPGQRRPGQPLRRGRPQGRGRRAGRCRHRGRSRRLGPLGWLGRAPGDGRNQGHVEQPPPRHHPPPRPAAPSRENGHPASSPAAACTPGDLRRFDVSAGWLADLAGTDRGRWRAARLVHRSARRSFSGRYLGWD